MVVKPSPRLMHFAAVLKMQVAICADPQTTSGQFAHARRLAVTYAKALMREFVACESLAVIMNGWQGVTVGTSTWNEQAAWQEVSRNPSNKFVG